MEVETEGVVLLRGDGQMEAKASEWQQNKDSDGKERVT